MRYKVYRVLPCFIFLLLTGAASFAQIDIAPLVNGFNTAKAQTKRILTPGGIAMRHTGAIGVTQTSIQAGNAPDNSSIKADEPAAVNHKNKLQTNMLLLVACLLTATLLIIIFYYRRAMLLNKQLVRQNAELQQLNTIKDKLFSVIGHDLRSPVGSIVSLLAIWESGNITEDEKNEVINHLKSQSKATLETLDKLLNWGQSQIKGISIFQTTFTPKHIIRESMELLKEQAMQKQISITDNVPPDMQVFADKLHFDFVIRNLLSNAIKFTHANGAIEISTVTGPIDGFSTFKVTDNGIGISKARQKAIFDATGDSTYGTANEKGTNVGLKLCKEYIVSNGGKIWVEGEEGKGSTFYFTVKATA